MWCIVLPVTNIDTAKCDAIFNYLQFCWKFHFEMIHNLFMFLILMYKSVSLFFTSVVTHKHSRLHQFKKLFAIETTNRGVQEFIFTFIYFYEKLFTCGKMCTHTHTHTHSELRASVHIKLNFQESKSFCFPQLQLKYLFVKCVLCVCAVLYPSKYFHLKWQTNDVKIKMPWCIVFRSPHVELLNKVHVVKNGRINFSVYFDLKLYKVPFVYSVQLILIVEKNEF